MHSSRLEYKSIVRMFSFFSLCVSIALMPCVMISHNPYTQTTHPIEWGIYSWLCRRDNEQCTPLSWKVIEYISGIQFVHITCYFLKMFSSYFNTQVLVNLYIYIYISNAINFIMYDFVGATCNKCCLLLYKHLVKHTFKNKHFIATNMIYFLCQFQTFADSVEQNKMLLRAFLSCQFATVSTD